MSQTLTFAVIGFSFHFFVAIPEAVSDWINLNKRVILSAVFHESTFSHPISWSVLYLTSNLALQLPLIFFQGWCCRVLILKMDGLPSTPFVQLRLSVKHFAPLAIFGMTILIAEVVGIFLLVIPGLMLIAATYVAIPSMVSEELGPRGSFDRSLELTRGARWPVFGLIAIYTTVLLAIGLTMSKVAAGPNVTLVAASRVPLNAYFINPIRAAIAQIIGAAFAAAAYCELMESKNGYRSTLADVFD